jgi:3-hydroxyanthranilate 3,4-dioxygenase
MKLRILEEGQPKDLVIGEGDVFVLPSNVPHSPQRKADTIGLVIEEKRKAGQEDGFLWICSQCHTKLYEEFIHVQDIVKQLPEVFSRFYDNPQHTTCSNCGHVATR